VKHLFFDTNVLVDYLTDREPYAIDAELLFGCAEKKLVKIYVSAVSFNNIYYVARKVTHHNHALLLLQKLLAFTEVVDLTKSTIEEAIKSEFADFEDALQYHCALTVKKIEALVTRNEKDFRKSNITVLSPGEALNLIYNKL
jgi:predicted nucleic acid-binding protein